MLLLLVAFSLSLIRYEDEYDDDGGDWYSGAKPKSPRNPSSSRNPKRRSSKPSKSKPKPKSHRTKTSEI